MDLFKFAFLFLLGNLKAWAMDLWYETKFFFVDVWDHVSAFAYSVYDACKNVVMVPVRFAQWVYYCGKATVFAIARIWKM